MKIMSTNKGDLTFVTNLRYFLSYVMMMINFGKLCKVIITPTKNYEVTPNSLL